MLALVVIAAQWVRAPMVGDTMAEATGDGAPSNRPLTSDGGLKERPRLSPDGKLVAFAWNGPDDADFDIYVKATELGAGSINVTDHPAGDGAPAWAPDGNALAFFRNQRGSLSVQVASWPGLETRKIVDVAGTPSYANHRIATLSWSPNGRFLAYGEKPSAEKPARIMRVDRATGETRALTEPTAGVNVIGDFEPAYSPSGEWIAFVRAPTSYSTLDIWTMNAEGEQVRRLTTGRWAFVHSLTWPTDTELQFTAGDLFSQRAYSVDVEEGTASPLPGLGDNDRFANVENDRFVYARYVMVPLRAWEIPVAQATDFGVSARDFELEGAKLAFARDGQRVAYIRGSGDGHVQIWTANRDGTDQTVLVDPQTDAFNPDWAPDGRRLLFNSLDRGNWDAYIIDVETHRIRRVTSHAADDYYPRFSRDGRWIYFSSNRSGRYEVYRMPTEADDSEAIAVTRGGGIDGVESHDGRYLIYERTQNADPSLPTDAPIWRMALDRNDDGVELLPSWGRRPERSWVLAESGIYLLTYGPDFIVRRLDLATNQISDIYRGTGNALYPSVSADEKSLFVSRETPRTSEIWLAENVRR